jgi:hypothetical protein
MEPFVPQAPTKTAGQAMADMLGGMAVPLSAVPVAGDIAGLAADAAMYATRPEERTLGNAALTLAGVLPFVPGASAAKAAEGALDMSQAARMQRAQEMGFDTERVFYHGTTSDFDEFDLKKAGKNDSGWYGRGIYLTPDPDTASAYTQYQEYAQRTGADGANVLPVRVRIKNPYYWPEGRKAALNKEESEAITQELLAQGFDGAVIPNQYADPKFADMYEVVAFNPNQVRSVNAAFDPAKRNSANLMAGIAVAPIGVSALRALIPQENQE